MVVGYRYHTVVIYALLVNLVELDRIIAYVFEFLLNWIERDFGFVAEYFARGEAFAQIRDNELVGWSQFGREPYTNRGQSV